MYYVRQESVVEHFKKREERLQGKGYDEYHIKSMLSMEYTNNTNILLSHEQQDQLLDYWIHLILEVDGGYWQVQELLQQPHSQFTHYKHKNMSSYEMQNVPITHAKKELNPKNYKEYVKRVYPEKYKHL